MQSTLVLGYDDYLAKVANFLGLPGPPFSVHDQGFLDDCVASGIRQFYFPPPMQGSNSPYDWSFLRPICTLDFAVGNQTALLPEDFGGFEGEITVLSPQTTGWTPIQLKNEGSIRQQYSLTATQTGRPLMAALQPLKGTTQYSGQRQQLYLFPQADQNYQLQFQYYILPDMLNGQSPFVYGGAAHVETILESCLAIAEQRYDDAVSVHTMKFAERLMASIGMDRKNKPQNLGYNGDRSDNARWDRRIGLNFPRPATYMGQNFG